VLKTRRRLFVRRLTGHIAAGRYRLKPAQSDPPAAAQRSVSAAARRIVVAWAAQSALARAARPGQARSVAVPAIDSVKDQSFSAVAPAALRIGPAQRWVPARAAADKLVQAAQRPARSACFETCRQSLVSRLAERLAEKPVKFAG